MTHVVETPTVGGAGDAHPVPTPAPSAGPRRAADDRTRHGRWARLGRPWRLRGTSRRPRSVARTLALAFALMLLPMVVLGGTGLVATSRIKANSDHLLNVINPASRANRDALQAMTNAETGVRGFLLARDARFLSISRIGFAALPADYVLVHSLLGTHAPLDRLLDGEKTASAKWITEYADPVIAGEQRAPLDGKQLFDAFRASNTAVTTAIADYRLPALQDLKRIILTTIVLIGIALLAGLALGIRTAIVTERRLVAPLVGASSAVVALAAGRLDTRLTPSGPLETRAVADSLNVLADQLGRVEAERAEATRLIEDANSQLVAANDELEAFSYSVSHDLRAPLRSMDGFSQVLLDDYAPQLPEEAAGHLRRVRAGAVRMSALIDALLALAHLGRQDLEVREVDPTDIARQALIDLADVVGDRNVDVTIGDLPLCRADPTLLGQVYANLLSNALKYSRDRDPAVIEVGSRDDAGRTVYFVADNGAGFDEAHASKMFGVFQRMHRADQFEGIGIGLALAQRIIGRHGGRIWAAGQVDQGATFSFTLGEDHR